MASTFTALGDATYRRVPLGLPTKKRGLCWHVVMHFRDYKEARAVLDAASLDEDRMFRIELLEANDA